jgi:hypothetical protein
MNKWGWARFLTSSDAESPAQQTQQQCETGPASDTAARGILLSQNRERKKKFTTKIGRRKSKKLKSNRGISLSAAAKLQPTKEWRSRSSGSQSVAGGRAGKLEPVGSVVSRNRKRDPALPSPPRVPRRFP